VPHSQSFGSPFRYVRDSNLTHGRPDDGQHALRPRVMTSSLTYEAPTGIVGLNERSWVRTVGRIGIASRGAIYLLLAYLAFDIARHGSAPTQTSSTGALQELESRTGGKLLVVVLAVGLGCYAGWRIFEGITGPSRGGVTRRISSFSVGIIYAILCVRAVQLVAGHPTNGGAASNPEPWVAKVMGWSGGIAAIYVVGAVLLGAGVGLGAWGVLRRYEKSLALERVARPWRTTIKILGGFGDVARGSLLVLVAVYLIEAAATADPAQAKSLDQALRTLVHHPFGALALGAMALGLLSFGIFSFFDARLRRLS
jgi:hypothetical protein